MGRELEECPLCGSKELNKTLLLGVYCKKCKLNITQTLKKNNGMTFQETGFDKKYRFIFQGVGWWFPRNYKHFSVQQHLSHFEKEPQEEIGVKVQEIKCTCNECGAVWHYLPHEKTIERGKAISNFGKNMIQASACCGNPAGCCGAAMPRDQIRDFDQCPKCRSRNCKKEVVEHEKPSN